MKLNYQSPPGQPGSFPLPNGGEPGQAYAQAQDKMHPAAKRASAPTQKPGAQVAGQGSPAAPVTK